MGVLNAAELSAGGGALLSDDISILKVLPTAIGKAVQAGTNTTDLAPYITTALASYKSLDFAGLDILVKTTINYSAFCYIRLSGGRITAQMTNSASPVFAPTAVATGNPTIATLYLDGPGVVLGAATVFAPKVLEYNSASGQGLKVRNMRFNGVSRAAGTRVLDAINVDFVSFRDCSITGYDKAFHFARITPRADTQCLLDNIGIGDVNHVGYVANVELLTINQVDVMGCGGGWYFGDGIRHLKMTQAHVEAMAKSTGYNVSADIAASTAKYGWGFWFADGITFDSIDLDQCEVFASGGADLPLGGFYIGNANNGANGVNFRMRNCYASPTADSPVNAAWIPLEVHRAARWEGKWFSNLKLNVVIGNFADTYYDFVVDEGPDSPKLSTYSLLPGSKVINLRSQTAPSGSLAVAITEYSDATIDNAHLLTFTGTGVLDVHETVSLEVGWHTFVVSGIRKTGTSYAIVRKDDASTIPLRAQLGFTATIYERTYRLPFYIDVAGTYRLGINAPGAATVVVGSLAVYRGFYPYLTIPRGAWDAPPVLALPTASAKWRGKLLTLDKAGAADDEVYACVRTSSGFAWKLAA